MRSVEALGLRLSKEKLSRDGALGELTDWTGKLEERIRPLRQNRALKRIRRAARTGGSGSSRRAALLWQRMKEPRRELGGASPSAKPLERLAGKLRQTARSAAAMAGESGALGEAAREALGRSLSQWSDQLGAMGMDLPDLESAISAFDSRVPPDSVGGPLSSRAGRYSA